MTSEGSKGVVERSVAASEQGGEPPGQCDDHPVVTGRILQTQTRATDWEQKHPARRVPGQKWWLRQVGACAERSRRGCGGKNGPKGSSSRSSSGARWGDALRLGLICAMFFQPRKESMKTRRKEIRSQVIIAEGRGETGVECTGESGLAGTR